MVQFKDMVYISGSQSVFQGPLGNPKSFSKVCEIKNILN